ncbi:ATP-dependent DNA helicase UvrD2 [Propionibacteriaceae bacterium G1746]|uniref:ATP-dependent DNA helicase UvrD2 n=1 Tax=Aestuariimicrobium sp. G57 TaxID=3418485 RepID=UPI003C25908C
MPTDLDATRVHQILDALDPEQRRVAEAVHGPVVVIAGAGTGKTRAITHRIAHASLTGVADPARTLAVTFTTRAAGEMRGRLADLGVHGVQARTFHSAALRQLQWFWPRAYGAELPPLSESRFGMVAEAASRSRLSTETTMIRDLSSEISWSKVSNVTPGTYPGLARATGREVNGLDVAQVAKVISDYEGIKRERGVIDFEDILLCTVAMMHEHPQVAAEVRDRYRHFTVDEYQDVSPLQQSLLMAWLGDRDDICVVGDPAQSIHSYAGARPDFLTGFARNFPEATTISLDRDYRSTPQVVDLANNVLHPPHFNGRSPGLVLRAQRPDGPAPVFEGHTTDADEARAVVGWLKQLAAKGIEWREMAVLFRINAQAPALEAALTEAGVPYVVRGSERFYERPEIRQALRLLAAHAQNTPDDPGLASVKAVLGGAGWTEEPPTGAGAARERWESLAALVDLASDIAAEDATAGLGPIVDELQQRAARQEAPLGQGVTLATLHSAKGLEWDAVALVGVAEGSIPFSLSVTPSAIDEERRLLYVGLTRAREHLRVSWSRTGGPGRGGRRMSRFLVGLTPGTVRDAAGAPGTDNGARRSRSALSQKCRVCGESLGTAAERKVGRHATCASTYSEALLVDLKAWRKEAADGAPAFIVFTDATLVAIAEAMPGDEDDLLEISGVGPSKVGRYGEAVLEIVDAHRV